VAVRSPRHRVALALLDEAGTPLAAPSANRFGRISPTSAEDVESELGDRVPLILDGGRCLVGVESTVLAVGAHGELTLLRPGGTPIELIERVAGARPIVATRAAPGAAPSPGMLDSHYAPRTPLILLDVPLEQMPRLPGDLPPRVGLLVQAGDPDEAAERLRRRTGRAVVARALSATGDREEAARNLFAVLRALDASGAELLLAEPCDDERGLGHAIGDRLRRAASRI
jgi:L-threonylcarbamoyladenylate synthase